jgi:hypothetical protein
MTVFYRRFHGELQQDFPEAVNVVGGLLCRLQEHLLLGSAEPECHILEFLAFVVRKEDGSLVSVTGNIPDKEDLLFVRPLRLVVLGLLLGLDMVAVVVVGLD